MKIAAGKHAPEDIRPRGHIQLTAFDAEGRVKRDECGRPMVREVTNLVVDAGLAWLSGALSGDTATPADMSWIGLGTGTTAAAAGDTALETEVESRVDGTQTQETDSATDDSYQCVGTVSITGTHAITEAGLFSAETNGTMLARQVFSALNLENGDSLQITWTITFAAAA